jgi:hypothetical protein
MSTLATIRTAAIAIAAFLVLGICSGLIGANVRRLAAEKGWDAVFLRAWNAAPVGARNMLSGWRPLRELWWVWLSLGLSVGLGVALWLLAANETATTISPAEIETAIAPIRDELNGEKQRSVALQSQLDTAIKERDVARQTLSAPPTAIHRSPLSHEERLELATKIDILKNAAQYFGAFINVYNSWSTLQVSWSGMLKGNRQQFNSEILSVKTNLSNASKQMEDLRSEYPRFHDISDIFSQPNTGATLKAIDDLITAVTSLPDPLPPDYDITVRPYVGTLTTEIDALLQWIQKSQKAVQNSLKELSALSRQQQ